MEVVVNAGANRRTPVGCKRDAVAAVEGGLRFLNNGAYKDAYVSHDGKYVYKIACRDFDGSRDNWMIEHEFEKYEHLNAAGHRWAPPTSLYTVDGVAVMAQPFYTPGDDLDCYSPRYQRLERKAYALERKGLVWDQHSGNWAATKRGELRIIDGV